MSYSSLLLAALSNESSCSVKMLFLNLMPGWVSGLDRRKKRERERENYYYMHERAPAYLFLKGLYLAP